MVDGFSDVFVVVNHVSNVVDSGYGSLLEREGS